MYNLNRIIVIVFNYTHAYARGYTLVYYIFVGSQIAAQTQKEWDMGPISPIQ